jgi:hypothetical protein
LTDILHILIGKCFIISVYLGFNTKGRRERFCDKESTRCSCLSFCKLSFSFLYNSCQTFYEFEQLKLGFLIELGRKLFRSSYGAAALYGPQRWRPRWRRRKLIGDSGISVGRGGGRCSDEEGKVWRMSGGRLKMLTKERKESWYVVL